jgi:curved DNA-binding protein
MEFKDYYKTLGLEQSATADDVKKAYRKLARKYHPDVSKEADAEERFKEVNEAYEVLKDAEKRAAYDQFGKDWKAGQEFRPPPDWDAGFEFRGARPGGGDFSDFFEALFGGGRSGFGFREARGRRGEDHHAKILVPVDEAYAGGSRTITLRVPEYGPDGLPRTRERSIRVTIPRGVGEGQRIRLAGQGAPGIGGGSAGDLFLEVAYEPHPFFSTDGKDILLELPVTPWEAALGATVPVPTLAGRVDLKVPPGSQTGKRMRLRGRGLPGSPPGDQIVSLVIKTPPADSAEARRIYEEMKVKVPFNPRRF